MQEDGPMSHFIEFYRAEDNNKAVDSLMEGNL